MLDETEDTVRWFCRRVIGAFGPCEITVRDRRTGEILSTNKKASDGQAAAGAWAAPGQGRLSPPDEG